MEPSQGSGLTRLLSGRDPNLLEIKVKSGLTSESPLSVELSEMGSSKKCWSKYENSSVEKIENSQDLENLIFSKNTLKRWPSFQAAP